MGICFYLTCEEQKRGFWVDKMSRWLELPIDYTGPGVRDQLACPVLPNPTVCSRCALAQLQRWADSCTGDLEWSTDLVEWPDAMDLHPDWEWDTFSDDLTDEEVEALARAAVFVTEEEEE